MIGKDLTTGSITPKVWSLAWPIMASMFFQTLYNAVDAFWVGRLSPNAIAAVSISQITLFVMISLSLGITVGSAVLMGMKIGARDNAGAERALGQAFVLALIAAALFTTLSLSFKRALLTASGATGEILPQAMEYFTIVAGGSTLMFVLMTVMFAFNAQGDNRIVTVLYAISTAINTVLDPVLIFGWLGMPALGIRGAAIATLVSQLMIVASGLLILSGKRMMIKFRLSNLGFEWKSVKKVFSIGLPASFTQVLGPLMFSALLLIISSEFAESGAVGFSIGFRIEFFAFLPAIGFGSAAMAMISQNIGAGKIDRVFRSFRTSLISGFSLAAFFGIIAVVLAKPIVSIFTSDPLVTSNAISYMRTVPLTYGMIAVLMVEVSSFQGIGRSWLGWRLTFMRILVAVLGTLILVRYAGASINGVWYSVIAANLTASVVGYFWVERALKRLDKSPVSFKPAVAGQGAGDRPSTSGLPAASKAN